ncbi:MAG: hypothetical protein M1485_07295, partial [Chloroflexi bacterium]|nr:hypothetical protein [Chloroflexota bacterium]
MDEAAAKLRVALYS